MNIKIYIIGNKMEKPILEGIKEYEKRLSRYCKIKWKLFKNEKQLVQKLSDKSYLIKISTKEKSISSETFSEKINTLGVTGKSDVTILINTENTPVDEELTFSAMEMDVGIKSLILFEQIYRAYRILNNEPYHK